MLTTILRGIDQLSVNRNIVNRLIDTLVVMTTLEEDQIRMIDLDMNLDKIETMDFDHQAPIPAIGTIDHQAMIDDMSRHGTTMIETIVGKNDMSRQTTRGIETTAMIDGMIRPNIKAIVDTTTIDGMIRQDIVHLALRDMDLLKEGQAMTETYSSIIETR